MPGRATHEYAFLTLWRVEGDIHGVAAILEDTGALSRWWPSVYLNVRVLEPGAPGGVGKLVDLHTKGWLPYTLRWRFRVAESNSPHGFLIVAEGDFEGSGRWTLVQEGPEVAVTFDWRIRAEKPLLRYLSFVFKPVFAANHRWAMARGLESLRLELQRRTAHTPQEAARVPPPPGPTFWSSTL